MKNYYTYILYCADGSYYVGITNNIRSREYQHNLGLDKTCYTFRRRPVKVVYFCTFSEPKAAISFEKRLKGWSRAKKEALIRGDYEMLPLLSLNKTNREKRKFASHTSTGSV